MKWEKVKLKDICASITDGTHQSPPKTDSGVPFITIANITGFNKIDFSNTNFVTKEYYEAQDNKRIAKPNDILYSVVGSFGVPVYIKEDIPFVFQRHIAILKTNENVNAKYLYYIMLSKEFYQKADTVALGAAQRTISLNSLRNLEVVLPPVDIQNRIASILSTYDDLIENNQKQIKLLEEAAQRLYKEWFVDLRFPGHENVKIVNGVPEGWENTSIGAFIKVKSGFAFKSKDWVNVGYPVVKIKDIHCNTIDTSDLSCVSFETVNGLDKYKLYKNDVVVAMTGATIGKVAIIPDLANLYVNQRVGKFFADNQITSPTAFIYCFFSQKEIREQILALSSSSSAQPNISSIQLESFKFIGCIDVINNFCGITSPFINKIIGLVGCIDLLVEARNRLLSKLMSGEIEL